MSSVLIFMDDGTQCVYNADEYTKYTTHESGIYAQSKGSVTVYTLKPEIPVPNRRPVTIVIDLVKMQMTCVYKDEHCTIETITGAI